MVTCHPVTATGTTSQTEPATAHRQAAGVPDVRARAVLLGPRRHGQRFDLIADNDVNLMDVVGQGGWESGAEDISSTGWIVGDSLLFMDYPFGPARRATIWK